MAMFDKIKSSMQERGDKTLKEQAFGSVNVEFAEAAVYITHDGDRIRQIDSTITVDNLLKEVNNMRNLIFEGSRK